MYIEKDSDEVERFFRHPKPVLDEVIKNRINFCIVYRIQLV